MTDSFVLALILRDTKSFKASRWFFNFQSLVILNLFFSDLLTCRIPKQEFTSLSITECHCSSLLVSKVPSPFLLQIQFVLFFLVKIKFHVIESKSFYDQDLSSCHTIDSVNLKITMQQGGIETFHILGNQINTGLDLLVQWSSG